MKFPKITNDQMEILKLYYGYSFLNRLELRLVELN